MNTPALAPVPTPTMPAPAPANAMPSRDGEPSAFARELQSASNPAAAADAPGHADTTPDDAATAGAPDGDAQGAASETARATTGRGQLARWLALAGAAERGPAADATATPAETPVDAEPADRGKASADDAAIAPEATTLLAALMPRLPTETTPASPATDAGEEADASGGSASPIGSATAARGTRGGRAGAGDEVGALPQAAAGAAEAADERLALRGHAQDEAALGAAAGPASASAGAASPLPGFAAELARAGHAVAGPAGSHAGAAATELSVPTPVGAPDFVPRLTGQLAVLARDGVQEARVQVNPLDLGPIAVQITLDGNAAQVRLAVDNAQTRDLLEQAMPALAAALRENGLTLTGGGVFQQAPGQGRDGQGADAPTGRGHGSGRGGDGEAVAAVAAPRRVRHPGQVDIYA